MKNRSSIVLMAVVTVLVGLNLRPIMASVGPLLDVLQHDLHLSSTEASLLNTFPVVMMGLLALAGPWLQTSIGEKKGVALGMLLIAGASAYRAVIDTSLPLIATAAIGGIGIAITQALMPAFLKRMYPDSAGTLMGLFTTGIMGGAALASSTAAPGSDLIGWRATLGAAAIPAIAALCLWISCTRFHRIQSSGASLPFHNPRAWFLLIFFGIGTAAYTLVLAWLPPYYVEQGWSSAHAGYLLGALTITEVVAGLLVSSLIHRFPDRRAPLAVVVLLVLLGLICLIIAPAPLAIPATLLLGLGIGALFPLSLIVTLDHARTPGEAGSLLAFVQGGGYLIAATMPFIAGMLRDQLSSLSMSWAVMAVGIVILLIMCLRLSPQKEI